MAQATTPALLGGQGADKSLASKRGRIVSVRQRQQNRRASRLPSLNSPIIGQNRKEQDTCKDTCKHVGIGLRTRAAQVAGG